MKQYIALLLLAMISSSAFATCLEVDGAPLNNGAELIRISVSNEPTSLRGTFFNIRFLKADGRRIQVIGEPIYASNGWTASGENRDSWTSRDTRRPNLRIDLRQELSFDDKLTGERRKVVRVGDHHCE